MQHVHAVPTAVCLVYRPPVASLTGKSGSLFFFLGILTIRVSFTGVLCRFQCSACPFVHSTHLCGL